MKDAFNCLYDDFFYRRHNYFWREQALQKLPILLSSTKMMACGEDLGMVPDCVPWVMHELQMLSLEIERMPKEAKYKFTPLEALPYLSVCTTSTHDMSPIRAWWKENRRVTQQYYNEVLHHEGVAPDVCSAQICSEILARHLQSTAMWVILPWQDWMSLDETLRNPDEMAERINVPANPSHYWCYRMHLYLEDLLMRLLSREGWFYETDLNRIKIPYMHKKKDCTGNGQSFFTGRVIFKLYLHYQVHSQFCAYRVFSVLREPVQDIYEDRILQVW